MDFYIRKGANLPNLKIFLINDGRPDYHSIINDLKDSQIFFSMYDLFSGKPKIVNSPCDKIEYVNQDGQKEYYIYFQFKTSDTNTVGRFRGELTIKSPKGVLISPTKQELTVIVSESISSSETCCPVWI